MAVTGGVPDLWTKQVLDAMLRQQGAVPKGSPFINPNFINMGPNTQFSPYVLSGDGTFSGLQSGRALVPYQAPGGLATTAAPIEAAAPNLSALGPEAPAAKEAAKRGLVGRALSNPWIKGAGVLGTGLGVLASNAAPGSEVIDAAEKEYPDGMESPAIAGYDYEAANLGRALAQIKKDMLPSDTDTGFTEFLKDGARGTGDAIANLIGFLGGAAANAGEFFTKTRAEKTAEGSINPEKGSAVEFTGQSSGTSGGGNRTSIDDFEYVMPEQDALQEGQAMNQLLQVLGALKPEKTKIPEGFNENMRRANFWDALANPKDPFINTNPLNTLMAANSKSALQEQLQALDIDKDYAKNTQDWLKEYAKTAVDIQKENRQAAKDDFKIHSTRGGFLVESTENGRKVLKPISANIFGDTSSKSNKFTIGDSKFGKNNPLSEELAILQSLNDVGVLNDVMLEKSKALAPAVKGIADLKKQEEAKILALAKAMRYDPNFKAQLAQKYIAAIGTAPSNKPTFDELAPPAAGAPDFLTTLTGGAQ